MIVPGVKTVGLYRSAESTARDILSCRNNGGHGWSAPATVRIEGGSVGFQIGGSETDLIHAW